MQPKQQKTVPQFDMFRKKLENMLSHHHELYQLARLIDWGIFEQEFGKLYSEEGRPGTPIRLMVGLTCLGHAFGVSDEDWRQDQCSSLWSRTQYPNHPQETEGDFSFFYVCGSDEKITADDTRGWICHRYAICGLNFGFFRDD